MTEPTRPNHRRLGLLGELSDPVAQLMEDLPEDASTDYVELTDPESETEMIDEALVLSQGLALAHLPGLLQLGKPCQILLRRKRAAAETASWADGLRLLADALRLAGGDSLQLVALSLQAANELQAMTGLSVGVLGQLRQITTERPNVSLRRGDDLIVFSMPGPDGALETRTAQLEVFSWVRLRRLARLTAADPDDDDLQDMVAFARGTPDAPAPALQTGPRCMVVVVPNGIGLGHVTRMLSIAKALNQDSEFRIVFWCFSRAAAIVQAAGFEVVLRQTALHLDAHPPDWRWWETLEFARLLRTLRPEIVAYDGAAFDLFVLNALRYPGCGRSGVLWVRRGMMRPDTDKGVLDPEQYSDLILEPGDLAVEVDRGPTRTAIADYRGFSTLTVAPPVTLKPYLPAYSRREALKRLRLPRGLYCLVSLGGAFGNWDQLLERITEQAQLNRVTLIWAQSPLSPPPGDPDAKTMVRQFYPFSPYLEAFDGVITATGYNSFHELMLGYTGPVMLAPTNLERLDDQIARATYARDKQWADVLYAARPEDHEQILRTFMAAVRRRAKVTNRPGSFVDQTRMVADIHRVCDRYAK